MQLFRSIVIVGFYTMGSRIFGFIRAIMMASFLGTSAAADALAVAIRLPSMLRRLFAEGAFSAAFVPLYTGFLSEKGKKQDAHDFAASILSLLVFCLLIVTFLAEFFMPSILKLMVFGFSGERLELTIQLARATFPFIIFISLCAFYGGILNSLNCFTAFASSPMIGNISVIIIALIGVRYVNVEYAFALSIFFCGLIQLLWVYVPAHRKGIKFQLIFPKLNPDIRRFSYCFFPAAAGSGVVQINIFVGTMIASLLPIGGVSILSYADRLVQFPLSVIGTAVGTALLPILSKQVRQGNIQGACLNQQYAIELAFFLMLPATASLLALAEPLITTLFERGKFGFDHTLETTQVLRIFSLGLPAYILIKIFSSSLFAQRDTRTPLVAAVVGLLIDIWLSLLLLSYLQSLAIAFATTVAAWINVLILSFILWYRSFFLLSKSLLFFCFHIVFISLLIFVILCKGQQIFSVWLCGSEIQRSMVLGFLVLVGFLFFFLGSYLSGLLQKLNIWVNFNEVSRLER